MSKGSARRPAQISDSEADIRWRMAFAPTADERQQAAVEWHQLKRRQMWEKTMKRNLGERNAD